MRNAAPSQNPAVVVEIPRNENLRLGRVGIIAVLGFGVGVLWPSLAGVRLVPSPPGPVGEAPSAESVPSGAESSVVSSNTDPAGSTERRVPASMPGLTIAETEILSCRDARGRKHRHCDKLEYDPWLRPRIQKLADGLGPEQALGSLVLHLEIDPSERRVKAVAPGKGTDMDQKGTEAVINLARRELSVPEAPSAENHTSGYWVMYRLRFARRGEGMETNPAGAPGDDRIVSATGVATVTWELALIRAAPSRQGQVVERIMQGTKVTVNARKGDWCRVQYDTKGNQGWVFRSSIGR